LADLMERGRNPVVGTTVSDTIMAIRVVARGPDGAVARRLLDNDRAEIKRRLGDAIFGEGETTLQEAVGHLLLDRKVTIATAESCTGGLLGKRLTDLPGSSAYFHRGYVTYSNEAKQELLGLSENLIAEHGAVSEPVAAAMASSAKTAGRADLAVSITGIAGPGGAVMPDKPIGLVFVGFAHSGGTQVHRLLLGETLTRQEVRDRSCKAALNIVRLHLLRSVTTQTT
jgi:nicotinamide-nucleotide amidase